MRYIKNGISALAYIIVSRILALFTTVNPKKVLFISDVRGSLGGNLKDVYDYLSDDYEKVTYLKADRRDISSPGVWLAFVYNMTTAGTILLEDYFRYTSYQKVREGQDIVQLWHACGAFKKFGYSRLEGNEGIRIHKGYRKYTKAITSSDAICGIYAQAFGLTEDKVKATGVPRTDIFFDEEYIQSRREELYTKYPILKEKKVILFAPTYRGLRADDAGYDFSRIDPDTFYNALKDDYVFVYKWHPAVYNNILRQNLMPEEGTYEDFFLDLSSYRDINDLLLVADCLITDYSSVVFDYYFTGKPIIFYAYDWQDYADGRGMYFPFQEYQYGPEVHDQEALIAAIREGDCMVNKRKSFGERFLNGCDGHSTEKTCAWIFGTEVAE